MDHHGHPDGLTAEAAVALGRPQASSLAASKILCKVLSLEHDLEVSKGQLAEALQRVQQSQEVS